MKYLIAESNYTAVNRYRKMVLAEGNLGPHKGLFRKLFAVRYLIQITIGFGLIIYRVNKDLFNNKLASFHMKE